MDTCLLLYKPWGCYIFFSALMLFISFLSNQSTNSRKIKDLSWSLHSPGPGPWWSPRPCCWFIKFSLLASRNQIFSCGAVFPDNSLNNQYIWKPQENSAGWDSRRIKLDLEDPTKKWSLGSILCHYVVDIIPIYRWLNRNLQHCHQFKNI